YQGLAMCVRLNGVQEVAGSNPVAPTLQGQSQQPVAAGLFSDLGTRCDPLGRVVGRDFTVSYYPIPCSAACFVAAPMLSAVPPSGIHPELVRGSSSHFVP